MGLGLGSGLGSGLRLTSIFLAPPKPRKPPPFSVPTVAMVRKLTCSGLGLGLGRRTGAGEVRLSAVGLFSGTPLSV